MKLEENIIKLKNLFELALKSLAELTKENFNDNLNMAKTCMQHAEILKEQLKKQYEYEELRPFESKLSSITKQINKTYDNIVENKRRELVTVAAKIESLRNQRKLIQYRR